MVPMQALSLKENVGYHCKYAKTDTLLYHLQLYQAERAAVALEAHPVGRHLAAILEESNSPRERYHADKRPLGRHACSLQLQMPIPSQSHKDVAKYEQDDSVKSVHFITFYYE